VIAGGGVRYSEAQRELTELSTAFGIPVAETSAGKGVTGDTDLLVGGIGVNGTRAANAIARAADLIVCVGTRLTDFTTGSHSLFQHADVRFLGINVCAADAHKLGATPVLADARVALDALADALVAVGWSTSAAYRDDVRETREQWTRDLAADLEPRSGERMSQGQLLRVLNEEAAPHDVVVAAAGFLPGDVLKLWDTSFGAGDYHLEFGFSCMGHEIPAALGFRMARPDAGEVYALLGDGSYLMAHTELVTAVQEGLKLTAVIVENGGFQSIHALQRATTGTSFCNEFRRRDDGRLTGEAIPIDYAANAASLGCSVFEASSLDELREALAAARREVGPVAIVAHAEPYRPLLGSDAWWDLGVAQASERAEMRELATEHAERAAAQRYYT
jgi:3D-(3,5/4)-trihydroxycyclohexane-1,2-dione acylhydrolase (decyclizing)